MKRFTLFLALLISVTTMWATQVKITMNAISTTMSLREKATGTPVSIGAPANKVYTFDVPAGEYIVTGYASNGTIANGDIDLTVGEEDMDIKLFTQTTYATNTGWAYDTDYTIAVRVSSREGVDQHVTLGNSATAGRKTFMMWNGNSYYVNLIPSAAHAAEGYVTILKNATITGNVTISASIPTGVNYSILVPVDAHLFVGLKTSHFIKYEEQIPISVTPVGNQMKYTYRLANSQEYNFRTWKDGKMTLAGIWTVSSNASDMPSLNFTDADYTAYNPKQVNHSVKANGGYETGDIFVNINEKNYLKMQVGATYDALAQRTWQLTNTSTANYFMEPCYHYTVYDLEGNIDNSVIEIDNANTTTDPWATIRAKAAGTAIVTVTYDAMNCNYYTKAAKSPYLGGENWGAIWPENTAVYVVSVGAADNAIVPNMVINQEYNLETMKNAGKYVDAEHDVFYYINDEESAEYTFTPSDVATVEIMYPTIRTNDAIYNTGFHAVAKNNDGSYTLHLKHGRQIVRLGDGHGNYEYQVLTAKHATREIKVNGREDASFFMPGDNITIQYDGLFHPANKLAGIYNMSAYITYNGVPSGDGSLILGKGQYTFGSAPSAQAVTLTIPEDWNVEEKPDFVLTDGCIQVTGYGDPIGNHRVINKNVGRNPNFTAIAHQTYFGYVPDAVVPIKLPKYFYLTLSADVDGVAYQVTDYKNNLLTPDAEGRYTITYGQTHYRITKPGYTPYTGSVETTDDSEPLTHISATMIPTAENSWDGQTLTAPSKDGDGYYLIRSGYHYAWFVNEVNVNKKYTIKAKLMNDIDLAGEPIDPIGGITAATGFNGEFDGQNHTITGLNIVGARTYVAMFGYTGTSGVLIHDFTVYGSVSNTKNYTAGICGYLNGKAATPGKIYGVKSYLDVYSNNNYVAGIAASQLAYGIVEKCENHGTVTSDYINASSGYVAGITANANNANAIIRNCINTATIKGVLYASGIVGAIAANTIENCYNTGVIICDNNAGSIFAVPSQSSKNINNCYGNKGYSVEEFSTIILDEARWQSGEVANLLGDAFGQEIGVDPLPVIGGKKVYKIGDGEEAFYSNTNYGIYERTGLTEGKIGTYCLGYSSDRFDGAEFYSIEKPVYDGSTFLGLDLVEETELEAGRPYIIIATAETMHVYYDQDEAEQPAGDFNGLVGSLTDNTLVSASADHYFISGNQLWQAGADFYVDAHRAYIRLSDVHDLSAAAPEGARRLMLSAERMTDTTTDLKNTETIGAQGIYDILGRQYKALPGNGMYIVNGKKVIVTNF